MADLAITRVQLVDNSRVRADGRRLHRILPWQVVKYDGYVPMIEPVDCLVGTETATQLQTSKQITGILFVDESFFSKNGTGGEVGMIQVARPYNT